MPFSSLQISVASSLSNATDGAFRRDHNIVWRESGGRLGLTQRSEDCFNTSIPKLNTPSVVAQGMR
jgi:hypothetical protein